MDVVGDRVGGAVADLSLDDRHDLSDDGLVEAVENLPDLGVGVAGDVARRHHRIVVGVHRGRAAHHALGEG